MSFLYTGRNADSARIGQAFEPRGNIYPVAENVAVLYDDVALVNADPKFDAFLGGDLGIILGHDVLNLSRTAQSINHTGKFDQQAIAGRFDDAAPVFSDFRIDNVRSDRL